ncbi:MAG: ferritin-like domain-containing protein [Polyangiales bacterium]
MLATLDLRSEARRHAPMLPSMPWLATAARETWRGRMINEHGSARVFEALSAQLARAGFAREIVDECARFADEERMHGVLCGAVVEALGGEASATIEIGRPLPEHADVVLREASLWNVLSVSCLSETIAVALIGAERLEMPEGALRDLLTRIWSDEIGHARFGWRVLTQESQRLDDDARVRLADYLAVAFAALEAHELAHLPESSKPPMEGLALGLCDGADARVLFYETIHEVIVPSLERAGIAARRAWERRDRRDS